jgi:hypothetical protein
MLRHGDVTTAILWTILQVDVTTKFTLQSNIRNTSDCQLQCGKCPKHVERSCNKTKILLLHLVGYLYTFVENDARNHEPKRKFFVLSANRPTIPQSYNLQPTTLCRLLNYILCF